LEAFLPTLPDLVGLGGLLVAIIAMAGLGLGAIPGPAPIEARLVAGWGQACLILTLWGVASPVPLWVPAWALLALGLGAFAMPGLRTRIGPRGGLIRILVLTLPLWCVMVGLRPSQIDTWLNLLPNAAYLVDVGHFPTEAGPPSHSFLPVAPYNTQFVALLASLPVMGLVGNAMALFNIVLQVGAALLIARILANGRLGRFDVPPPTWACATGFLIAIAANPGFKPNFFFSSYGEAPLAVTLLFATWAGTRVIGELAEGRRWPASLPILALSLAAMVNTKQSASGLVLALGASLAVVVLCHPRLSKFRGLLALTAAFLPAILLWGVWRWFATGSFAEGELKLLPVDQWNWAILPGIGLGILKAIWQKMPWFLAELAVLPLGIRLWRRAPWREDAVFAVLVAGTILVFTGFLVFTYVSHFPPDWALEAHSFFRYSSQLSIAVMLALTLALRPILAPRLARARSLGIGAVLLVLVLPLALAGSVLRYDLETPQPDVWRLAQEMKPLLPPGRRLALVLPGDINDTVGSMLRGVLRFVPPRVADLDETILTRVDPGTLEALAGQGFDLALISCTPAGLSTAPPGVAALFTREGEVWRVLGQWSWPPDLARRHFGAMLARGPLCAAQP
jgi:hypothetical protein